MMRPAPRSLRIAATAAAVAAGGVLAAAPASAATAPVAPSPTPVTAPTITPCALSKWVCAPSQAVSHPRSKHLRAQAFVPANLNTVKVEFRASCADGYVHTASAFALPGADGKPVASVTLRPAVAGNGATVACTVKQYIAPGSLPAGTTTTSSAGTYSTAVVATFVNA